MKCFLLVVFCVLLSSINTVDSVPFTEQPILPFTSSFKSSLHFEFEVWVSDAVNGGRKIRMLRTEIANELLMNMFGLNTLPFNLYQQVVVEFRNGAKMDGLVITQMQDSRDFKFLYIWLDRNLPLPKTGIPALVLSVLDLNGQTGQLEPRGRLFELQVTPDFEICALRCSEELDIGQPLVVKGGLAASYKGTTASGVPCFAFISK